MSHMEFYCASLSALDFDCKVIHSAPNPGTSTGFWPSGLPSVGSSLWLWGLGSEMHSGMGLQTPLIALHSLPIRSMPIAIKNGKSNSISQLLVRAEGKSNSILPSNGPVCSSTKWAFMKPDWDLIAAKYLLDERICLTTKSMLHPIISTRKVSSQIVSYRGCGPGGFWTAVQGPWNPTWSWTSHKAPKPRNLPLPSSRSSYLI